MTPERIEELANEASLYKEEVGDTYWMMESMWQARHIVFDDLVRFASLIRAEVLEEAAIACETHRLITVPIGPLFGVGWDSAVEANASQLRALKDKP